MAVSEKRSSARVAPRSEILEHWTSAMTSLTLTARESTAPVQVASPTVRNRTVSSMTSSSDRGWTHSAHCKEHAVASDDLTAVVKKRSVGA